MKKKYIIYPLVNDNILLFLKNSTGFSGYITDNLDFDNIDILGIVDIFVAKKHTESLVFCLGIFSDQKIATEVINKLTPNQRFLAPTWFSSNFVLSPNFYEFSNLQKKFLPLVLSYQSFKSEVFYPDDNLFFEKSEIITNKCSKKDLNF